MRCVPDPDLSCVDDDVVEEFHISDGMEELECRIQQEIEEERLTSFDLPQAA